MDTTTCRHPEGCETGRPVCANGLCSTHYNRFNRTGDFGPPGLVYSPRGTNVGQVCKERSCDQLARSRGWCSLHYQRVLARGTTALKERPAECSVLGCERPNYGKGLCQLHWWRNYRTGELGGPDPVVRIPRSGPCIAGDCENPVLANGLCEAHYRRMRSHGSLEDARQTKLDPNAEGKACKSCEKYKPMDGYYRNNGTGDGRLASCKSCYRVLEFARRNGFSIADVREFVRTHEGDGCAICGRTTDLTIDHCHDTNVMRWILCRKCNTGIGMFDHDPELLRKAAALLVAVTATVS